MDQVVGSSPIPIELYMIPDGDRILHYYNNAALVAADSLSKHQCCQVHSETKWPAAHEKHFAKKRLPWAHSTSPSPNDLERFPLLLCGNDREYDVMQFHGVRQYPEKESFIVETGQSINRAKRTCHNVGAITPNSKFYVANKCRWLLGVEHLALQSIFYENRIELMRYEDSLLKSLAGNAFEGSCCAAAIYATCRPGRDF